VAIYPGSAEEFGALRKDLLGRNLLPCIIKASRHQGIKASRHQGIKASRHQGIKASRHSNGSGSQGKEWVPGAIALT